jgi:hypothetical protein
MVFATCLNHYLVDGLLQPVARLKVTHLLSFNRQSRHTSPFIVSWIVYRVVLEARDSFFQLLMICQQAARLSLCKAITN